MVEVLTTVRCVNPYCGKKLAEMVEGRAVIVCRHCRTVNLFDSRDLTEPFTQSRLSQTDNKTPANK